MATWPPPDARPSLLPAPERAGTHSAADDQELLLEELLEAVACVAARGEFVGGAEPARLEDDLAALTGAGFVVSTPTAVEALVIGLRALGVRPGDAVATPALCPTPMLTALGVLRARTAWVAVDPASGLMTAAELVAAISRRPVRAVLASHLFGAALDVEPIAAVCEAAGLPLLEDAGQALGADAHGRPAGSRSRIGCLAFSPDATLGAWGQGGAVLTSDERLAARVQALRTGPLDAVQAAVLRAKLPRLDTWLWQRRAQGAVLAAALAGTPVAPLAGAGDHVYDRVGLLADAAGPLAAQLARAGVGVAATDVGGPSPLRRRLLAVAVRPGEPEGALHARAAVLRELAARPAWARANLNVG